MKILLVLLSAFPAFPACLPVTGDRILGRDLALADPRFAAVPASYTVTATPPPGARRVLAGPELERLAKAHGISLSLPGEVCFEVPLRQLEDEELTVSMRRSLPPGAEITLIERSTAAVPAGEVEFPPASLAPAAAGDHDVQLWRGFVKYTSTRRVAIWARVAITQELTAVVASRNLAQNVPVEAASVRLETRRSPLVREALAERVEDVIGRIPKRPVNAGSLVPLGQLDEAPLFHRGDPVKVEVLCGPTRLRLDAVAEREGRAGQIVELRNPSTGKTFHARLDGSRAVVVLPPVVIP